MIRASKRHRRLRNKFGAIGLIAFACSLTAYLLFAAPLIRPAAADDGCTPLAPMLDLDRRVMDLRREIEIQNKTITEMQRLVDESRMPGGSPPDIKRMNTMGQPFMGVLGVGKSKPVEIQEILSNYESLTFGEKKVDDHFGDIGLQKATLLRERANLVAQRKKELGYPSGDLLPESEMRRIKEMALGRAVYITEIKRSREIRDAFQKRIAEINRERMAVSAQLGPLDWEKYRNNECTPDGLKKANGQEVKVIGNEKEKPDVAQGPDAAVAAAAAVRKQTKQELEGAKSIVGHDLSQVELLYTNRIAIVVRCETAVGKAPDLSVPGSDFDDDLEKNVLMWGWAKTALERADSVATDAQAKTKLITSTQQAANQACAGTPTQPTASDKGQLDTKLDEAPGTYERIERQINSALAAIAKPVDLGALSAMRASMKKMRSYCDANKDIYDTKDAEDLENAHKVVSAWTHLEENLAVAEHDAAELGGDVEIELLKIRWANIKQKFVPLRERAIACLKRARTIQEDCRELSAGIQLEKLDKHIAEASALERRRQATRQKLTNLLNQIGDQYTAAKQAVARDLDCIDKASQAAIASAETALGACRLKESRQMVSKLPESPRRSELVKRWNRTYEIERKARKLLSNAMGFKDQGTFSKAISTLQEAKALGPCETTASAIDRAITDVRGAIADANADAAQEALSACQFNQSRQLIAELPQGPRRQSLVKRWNRAYETERKARDLANEAARLVQQGEPGKAIGNLHRASDLGPCDKTVAAIDRAIEYIRSKMAEANAAKSAADRSVEANRRCVQIHGPGWLATKPRSDGRFDCHPPKTTAGRGQPRRSKGGGCPPDHILMSNGKCLSKSFFRNLGKSVQGMGTGTGGAGVR